MANLPVASFADGGLAALSDLFYAVRSPYAVGDDRKLTFQQVCDGFGNLPAAAALALTDNGFPLFQLTATRLASVQQVHDSAGVLAVAASAGLADRISAVQAGTARYVTLQQIFNAIGSLGASGLVGLTDELPVAVGGLTVATTFQNLFNSITQLGASGVLTAADTVPVTQAGVALEATLAQVNTFIESNASTFLRLSGSAFLITGGSANSTTNGTALLAAYVTAQAATPHGAALSVANRFTVFLLPGVYSLGTSELTLSTQFIDIVGLGADPIDCLVTSSNSAVRQTADDVCLKNFCAHTSETGNAADAAGDYGYKPDGALANAKCIRMVFSGGAATPTVNGTNRAMRGATTYSGVYVDCWALTDNGFGGAVGGIGGTAGGSYIRCICNQSGFAPGGTASGNFYNCMCSGGGFGSQNTASGVFMWCQTNNAINSPYGTFGASTAASFGGGSQAGAISANGSFFYCTSASTTQAFGANAGGGTGTANGTYLYCTAQSTAFGSSAFGGVARFCRTTGTGFAIGVGTTNSGICHFCETLTGGFAGSGGTFSGTASYCRAGDGSFGGRVGATGGTMSGTCNHCIAGDTSFGGGTTGGTMSGNCRDCVAGAHSYASGSTTGGLLSGTLTNCTMVGEMRVNLTGKILRTDIIATAANTSALTLVSTSTGSVYFCVLTATGSGASINVVSGTPTIKCAHCVLNKGITGALNAIATPYNVDDANAI